MPTQIQQTQFTGGVNTEDFLASLAEDEMAEAINAVITKNGSIKKREGVSEDGSDGNSDPVYALSDFEDKDNNYWKLKFRGSKVVERNGGSWDNNVKTGLTSGKYLQMSEFQAAGDTADYSETADSATDFSLTDTDASWNDNQYRDYIVEITSGTGSGQVRTILDNESKKLYIDSRWDTVPDSSSDFKIYPKVEALICNNGTDTPFKIIGDGGGGLTTKDIDSVPKSEVQLVANGRLWVIDGTKVRWSSLGNGEAFDDQNFIDTGEPLVSLAQVGDYVAVYSKTKTGVITGNDADTFSFRWRDDSHGCIAAQSVASWGDYSLALADDGVYMFDGSNNELCSRKIQPDINAIKDSLKSETTGFVQGNKYYLMHAQDSASSEKDRIWVMDMIHSKFNIQEAVDIGVWTVFEGINANVMDTFEDSNGLINLYAGKSDNSKVLQLYDGSYNDLGSSIVYDVQTREYDLNSLGREKKMGWFYYEGFTDSNSATLQLSVNLGNKGFESFGTIDHKQEGSKWGSSDWDVATWGGVERTVQRLRPGGRNRTFQFKFFNNNKDEPIEMFKYEQYIRIHSYH